MEDSVVINKVWPSGSAFATAAAPIRPAAPARLSTKKDCSRRCCRCGVSMRAIRSAPPPGANGTTIRTGRTG